MLMSFPRHEEDVGKGRLSTALVTARAPVKCGPTGRWGGRGRRRPGRYMADGGWELAAGSWRLTAACRLRPAYCYRRCCCCCCCCHWQPAICGSHRCPKIVELSIIQCTSYLSSSLNFNHDQLFQLFFVFTFSGHQRFSCTPFSTGNHGCPAWT